MICVLDETKIIRNAMQNLQKGRPLKYSCERIFPNSTRTYLILYI